MRDMQEQCNRAQICVKFTKTYERQSVIVIHGIGEQKPMSTIRDFVDSISTYRTSKKWMSVYNIRDAFSGSDDLPLRSMYYGDNFWTNFFEYYQASCAILIIYG